MIDSRWSSITFGLVAALMLAGCSKTEDTAPERRVFGSPPAIESVSVVATQDTVSCDFTAAFDCALINDPCSFDYNADPFQCPVTDPTNPAYDFDGPNIVHVTPGPLMIGGTYTKVHFEVKATDPESTPGHSDILLVSATYPVPDAKGEHPENTIVLLDDGSHQSFPFT
ncbi:MAG TPA: hypothetical protein VFT43_02810, partial [Candidatus Polarisedimenticolia bacterium]|nr:hypothetical protein [Candidatus Polarisedimenticolia bacterium]